MVPKVDVVANAKSKGRVSFGTTTLPLPVHHNNYVIQSGGTSVGTGLFVDDTGTDHEATKNNNKIESASEDIESPKPSGALAQAIEARVVKVFFACFGGRENEMYARQKGEKEAAQAKVFFDEDKEQGGRSFLLRGCLCVMLVLVIVFATTTGVAVARKTSPEVTYGSGMTLLFTPETSAQPSLMPSAQPSPMPTSEPLNNSYCEEVRPLVVGQTVSGSFKDAIQSMVVNCQAQTKDASSAFTSSARWYLYRGEGFPVALRADEFVDIHVHLTCSDTRCPPNIHYPISGGANPVIWEAKQGTDYLILVAFSHKSRAEAFLSANFTLTIEPNDSMETAFGPLIPGHTTVMAGSTVGTKVSEAPDCGSASAPTGPGVWYSVMGNGKTIVATVSYALGSPRGLDPQISVFSAENVCIDGNDDSSSGKSQVAWKSNYGEIYFVLVHGKAGAEGTFILQATTEDSALADADFCANAKLLELGSTEEVDLSQATVDADLRSCTEMSYDGTGNFYTFNGTGKSVHISWKPLAFVSPFYIPPHVAVLTGPSCTSGALECIHPDCEYDCEVPTTLGQSYLIYVFYNSYDIEESFDNQLNRFVNLTINDGANIRTRN